MAWWPHYETLVYLVTFPSNPGTKNLMNWLLHPTLFSFEGCMKRLLFACVSLVLLGLFAPIHAEDDKEPVKRLLLITESRGYRHSCVTRKVELTAKLDPENLPKIKGVEFIVVKKKVKDQEVSKVEAMWTGRADGPKPVEIKHEDMVIGKAFPCVVETTMMELGKKHGFTVVASQDSRGEITGDNLKNFDAVFFFTTGELPLSDAQKTDLLGFVKSGKGFGGSHCAADTFYKWTDYGDMIGAYFAGHPPGFQKIRVIVEDKDHPATKHLGDSFAIEDEIYQFKSPYGRDKVRVLLSMDMKSTKNLWRKDGDNPLAWVRDYGKGHVFYTAFGHREEVWADPRFQQHVLGGLRFLFGQEKADATPRGERK